MAASEGIRLFLLLGLVAVVGEIAIGYHAVCQVAEGYTATAGQAAKNCTVARV